jgi:glycosyltransferase involved in cell wall biosynthesis
MHTSNTSSLSSQTLGFACEWLENKPRTWSYVPYLLMQALEECGKERNIALHDLDCGVSARTESAYKLRNMTLHNGKIASKHRQSVNFRQQIERNFHHALKSAPALNAVLQISDIAAYNHAPSFMYADVNVQHLIDFYRTSGKPQHSYEIYSLRDLERRGEHQRRIYETLTGAFTMSHWAANVMKAQGIIPADNIHAVHCAANLRVDDAQAAEWRSLKRGKFILFVGREFFRKGGDLTVEAFTRFRKGYGEDVSLVIAGPEQWQLQTPIPDGVNFVGAASYQDLQRYFVTADAFCMPSHYEAFGVVFAEALCAGVPVIGQRAYATPEIITHGKNGYLLDTPDPELLAELMAQIMDNHEMQANVLANVQEPREYYSWRRIANDMLRVMLP